MKTTRIKSYDATIIELLTGMLAKDLCMVRDEVGYTIPYQHKTKEELESIVGVLYDALTYIEVEKFGKKLMEEENER